MNKSILIFIVVLITFSLTTYGYMNWNNTTAKQVGFNNDLVNASNKQVDLDLFYRIGNRWSTMTKEDLNQAKSIIDILSGEATRMRDSYKNVTVSVLHNDKDVRDIKTSEIGQSEVLNAAQIKLLRSCGYSTNIRITALNRLKNAPPGKFEYDSLVHYLTIIPEKEAEFAGGLNALIEYLKESSKEKVAIIEEDQLQPGKVFFTITKEGSIENVKVISTSGYPSVDKELVKIISNMPEKWNPAANSIGEKVDQEFVFFFGIEGC